MDHHNMFKTALQWLNEQRRPCEWKDAQTDNGQWQVQLVLHGMETLFQSQADNKKSARQECATQALALLKSHDALQSVHVTDVDNIHSWCLKRRLLIPTIVYAYVHETKQWQGTATHAMWPPGTQIQVTDSTKANIFHRISQLIMTADHESPLHVRRLFSTWHRLQALPTRVERWRPPYTLVDTPDLDVAHQHVSKWLAKNPARGYGFDTESVDGRLALIQLATHDACLLIRCPRAWHKKDLPKAVRILLGDAETNKYVVDGGPDEQVIAKTFEHQIHVAAMIDIAKLADLERWGFSPKPGLGQLALMLLGQTINKSHACTMSDWFQDHLTTAQIDYAVQDAYLAFVLHRAACLQTMLPRLAP